MHRVIIRPPCLDNVHAALAVCWKCVVSKQSGDHPDDITHQVHSVARAHGIDSRCHHGVFTLNQRVTVTGGGAFSVRETCPSWRPPAVDLCAPGSITAALRLNEVVLGGG
ncbi:hypothetical protein EYF80_059254 [Liparis tanakae]|uniref:Uncharacterized protein n=1 Tax=Liparis tanakae TaxID=230148 RepID=A0A4Z2ENX0_9TELE|nr:hypothetical protein EYF80_059254 [Liparis tanakae]